MKQLFDAEVRAEVIKRINSLETSSTALWGKMSVHQMVKHCIIWDEWVQGTHKPVYKQLLIGWIFGRMALKGNVKDDRPIKKNMPTGRDFTVKEEGGDLEVLKSAWIALLGGYAHYSNPAFVHDFFGRMTRDEIGIFAYKHADHHLQFGV